MTPAADLYLELLKRVLVNSIYRDPRMDPGQPAIHDEALRREGKDWPRDAHTMIGRFRLDNLDRCCRAAIADEVPGDFLEAGVWRGGAGILMRGVLAAFGAQARRVFLADSFEGLPPPSPGEYPADQGDRLYTFEALKVSEEQVRDHFDRYNLLDDRVVFLKGWFKDTLHTAPIERLAVLRLDGDMYESTWQALEALYDKVSPGGYVIIDDYGCIPGCRKAVQDFRDAREVKEEIIQVDWTGIYWRKSPAP